MVEGLLETLGSLIYPLFSIIFLLIDLLQELFAIFAGTSLPNLNSINANISNENTGEYNETGLVFYLLNTSVVRNLLVSISFLALFLLIIFTTMAFIKNVYAAQPKSWKVIVGDAIKGLANFIFLPVCCLLGIWLGNILLNAIDGATRLSDSTNLSRQLFVVSAYDANRVRNGDWGDTIDIDEYNLIATICENNSIAIKEFSNDPNGDGDVEYYADIIDQCFSKMTQNVTSWSVVNRYYNLMGINYIILGVGGVSILYSMFYITFGMVKRMFMLLFLFVISPALCSLYPLDNGSAAGKWKNNFISNTISAYGAIAGMNLFFSISPLIQEIDLTTSFGGFNVITQVAGITTLLLSVAGLYVVKDFISLVNGYIGGGNALDEGKGLWGSTKGGIKDKLTKARDKVSKKVNGAFQSYNKRRGQERFFADQVKSGAMTQAEADAELKRQREKATKDAFKETIKKWTGIDTKGISDASDEGYQRAGSEFAKQAHKRQQKQALENIKNEMPKIVEQRAQVLSDRRDKKITNEEAKKQLDAINKNLERLVGKAEDAGTKEAILSVAGYNPESYKKYKDAKKEVDDTINDVNKKAAEVASILQTYRGDTKFEGLLRSGGLHSAKEIERASSDAERQAMNERNQQLIRVRALNDSIEQTKKGFEGKVQKFTETGSKVDGRDKDRQYLGQEMVSYISKLSESLKSTSTIAAANSAIDKLKINLESSKTMDRSITEKLARTVESKMDDILEAVKQREKASNKK